MTSIFTPPPEMVEACHHEACEFKTARCPKCGAPLITNGLALWCSFIGGRDEPACAWMLDLRPIVSAAIAVLAPMIGEEAAKVADMYVTVSGIYEAMRSAPANQWLKTRMAENIATAIRSKFPSATGENK